MKHSSMIIELLLQLLASETMRITEIKLNTTENQPREAQSRSEHQDAQRLRKRGDHAAKAAKPARGRQTRRRAAHAGEHRQAGAETRAVAPGLSENSLDQFLRAARMHKLLTADEEVELAKRIERGDLEAKER